MNISIQTGQKVFTNEERAVMKETDEEFRRRGFFKRIFPCFDFLYYKQFFEEDRPLNYLLDAKLYHKRRGNNASNLRKNQAMPLFMQKQQLGMQT